MRTTIGVGDKGDFGAIEFDIKDSTGSSLDCSGKTLKIKLLYQDTGEVYLSKDCTAIDASQGEYKLVPGASDFDVAGIFDVVGVLYDASNQTTIRGTEIEVIEV